VAKGWDRVSIAANSRPIRPRRRDVAQKDLLVPSFGSKLALFVACLACGAMLAVLWGFFGGLFVTLLLGAHSGSGWVAWSMLAIGVLSTVSLFAFASRERKHDPEWLERF
jgi:hypothetical protein